MVHVPLVPSTSSACYCYAKLDGAPREKLLQYISAGEWTATTEELNAWLATNKMTYAASVPIRRFLSLLSLVVIILILVFVVIRPASQSSGHGMLTSTLLSSARVCSC